MEEVNVVLIDWRLRSQLTIWSDFSAVVISESAQLGLFVHNKKGNLSLFVVVVGGLSLAKQSWILVYTVLI